MSVSFAEVESSAESIWFVSDVHLRHGDDDYLRLFTDFLERADAEAGELWIVGDLFEFWIGDRQARDGFYDPLFCGLARIASSGRRVRIVHGNRDFLMGKSFRDAGCELLADQNLIELEGLRVHVSHGDELCLEDHGYQRARRVMRSAPARGAAALMPGWLGGWLARRYRRISESSKARRKVDTGNRFHTIEKGLAALAEARDPDVVICGHIHYLRDQELEIGGRPRRVITTGAWEEGPNFVHWAQGRFELKAFPQA
jgi:UDP-2,3-diacylglucosamine hydrolase